MQRTEAQDRVLAHAEARGDARGIHRRAQERAHDTLALGVEEAIGTALRPVADDRDGALQETQLAREQAPGMRDLAVARHQLLEQDGELLALLQLALEVDVERERPHEVDHRRRRRAGLDAALLQRAVALAFDAHDARAHFVDLLLGIVGAVILAAYDVLSFRLRADRQCQHTWCVGLLRNRLHRELDGLAHRESLPLQERLEPVRDLPAVGLGHADVGQHPFDGIALLEAQRQFVDVAGGRLGLRGGVRRLHLEAPQVDRRRLSEISGRYGGRGLGGG